MQSAIPLQGLSKRLIVIVAASGLILFMLVFASFYFINESNRALESRRRTHEVLAAIGKTIIAIDRVRHANEEGATNNLSALQRDAGLCLEKLQRLTQDDPIQQSLARGIQDRLRSEHTASKYESAREILATMEGQEQSLLTERSLRFDRARKQAFVALLISEAAAVTGFFIAVAFTAREFRRRNRVEVLLEQARDELEKRVEARTRELARSTEALKEKTVLMETILDSMEAAVQVCDESGRIILVNKAFTDIYGVASSAPTPEAWLKQTEICNGDGSPLGPEDLPLSRARQGVRTSNVPLQITLATGQRRHVSVTASPLVLSDTFRIGAVAVLHDETEKRRIEQQFLQAQRLESIGSLASGIVHDLNNVLAPILMSVDLLKLDHYPESGAKYLDLIEASAKRGADLAKQILTFARGLGEKRQVLSLGHIIADVAKLAKESFPKGIRVTTDVHKDLWLVVAEPTQMHQVLMNLCVNSRDAMGTTGRLTIRAHNCQTTPDESLSRKTRYVQLAVSDTGPGVPKKIQSRIFEPFFTTKDVGHGTGLGLSTVMAIVKNHGGTLRLESVPSEGATFRIFLPATDEMETESMARGTEIPRGQGEQILVVDDEVTIQKLASEALNARGYLATAAADGAEAIAILAKNGAIAVILTDYEMPLMSGNVLREAALRINPRLRIIGMSGSEEGEAFAKLTHGFLRKPFGTAELLAEVGRVLDR